MTDTTYGEAAAKLPLFRIREVRAKQELHDALSEDRSYAAYALGHLEPGLFKRSRFWVAEGERGTAVVLHATAIGRTLIVGGDPEGVDAILSLHPGARITNLTTAAPEHLPALKRTYALSDTLHMQRMTVTQHSFAPVDGALQRLRGSDLRQLNALYAIEGRPSYYTQNHIEHGVYYGTFEERQLVSVAGTHIVAPHVGIAVVGNVFTHPAHRGRGLATRVTSRVTGELLAMGCPLVTLTVDPDNTPAVRAYHRLGYAPGARVIEAQARRRDLIGVSAAVRRWAARRRGTARSEHGTEYATGLRPDDTGPDPDEGASP